MEPDYAQLLSSLETRVSTYTGDLVRQPPPPTGVSRRPDSYSCNPSGPRWHGALALG